jgi:hypothetical protein
MFERMLPLFTAGIVAFGAAIMALLPSPRVRPHGRIRRQSVGQRKWRPVLKRPELGRTTGEPAERATEFKPNRRLELPPWAALVSMAPRGRIAFGLRSTVICKRQTPPGARSTWLYGGGNDLLGAIGSAAQKHGRRDDAVGHSNRTVDDLRGESDDHERRSEAIAHGCLFENEDIQERRSHPLLSVGSDRATFRHAAHRVL